MTGSPGISNGRCFDYGRGSAYWWRYLPVGVGLAFVYAVLAYHGTQPFSGFGFPLLIGVVLLDVVVVAVLRNRAPRSFRITDEKMLIQWANGLSVAVSLDSVSVRRELAWLVNSGTVLKADGKTFAVFKDLRGFNDLLSACNIGS